MFLLEKTKFTFTFRQFVETFLLCSLLSLNVFFHWQYEWALNCEQWRFQHLLLVFISLLQNGNHIHIIESLNVCYFKLNLTLNAKSFTSFVVTDFSFSLHKATVTKAQCCCFFVIVVVNSRLSLCYTRKHTNNKNINKHAN